MSFRRFRPTFGCVGKARFWLELELLRRLPISTVIRWLKIRARMRCVLARIGASRSNWVLAPQAEQHAFRRSINAVLNKYLSYLLMTRSLEEVQAGLDFAVEGWHHVEEAIGHGSGAVLLTCHVGVPRLLRWYLRSTDLPTCHVFGMGVPRHPKNLDEQMQLWMRSRFCIDDEDLVGDDGFSIQYMKQAYDCLRNNGLVNIAGDGGLGQRRVSVTILGKEHQFPAGGLSLGLLSGAPILPCFTVVEPGPKLRIEIQSPLSGLSATPKAARLQAAANAYAERVATYVTDHPTNVRHRRYVSSGLDRAA